MKPLFGHIMVRHWTDLRRSGVSVATYMDCNRDMMAMLLVGSDFEAFRQRRGDYISVKGALGRLIASSACGKSLFGFTGAAIEAQDFSSKAAKPCRSCTRSSRPLPRSRNSRSRWGKSRLPMQPRGCP